MMTSLNRLSTTAAADGTSNSNTTSTTVNVVNPLGTSGVTSSSGKKKFGKNLNKLTKPPAPPAASESAKANAASRNGLLLLSTNKRNSGSGPSNGLLASKPIVTTPLPSLGLQYESSTSTHDVLLGAVVGAAASRAEQTPDAWGVAAAQNNSNNHNNNFLSNNNPPPFDDTPKEVPAPVATPEKPVESSPPPPPPRDYPPPRKEPHHNVVPSSNWDEYGGRGPSTASRGLVNTDRPPSTVVLAPNNSNNNNNNHYDDNVDSQQVYMAKLARERAERRRQEEAARTREQNEKAAMRLRALESKMEGDNQKKGVILEPLGSNGHVSNNNKNNAPAVPSRPVQRTLYDPNQGSNNRTYSSFVGGGTNGVKDHHNNNNHKNGNSAGASVGSRDDPKSRGNNGDLSPRGATTPGAYSGPVIHLNSYEDRDRGEAARPAAPRMLFDPKSGSMVAVPSRDENPRGGGGGKNSNKGGRGKGRNNKQQNGDDDNHNNNGNSRGGNNKQSKGKNGKKGKAAGKNSSKASKGHPNADRKLPRTRGVLYARDDKGNCYCADGCDGDLGYGAHSVPGGRVRNPDAYSALMEQQQMYQEHTSPSADHQRSQSSERYDAYHGYDGYNPYDSAEDMGMAYDYDGTGYSMEEGAYVSEEQQQQEEEKQPELEWVKPNEKIELVTGMDEESPTLQATAREWAPSQAALAAAAQAAAMPSLGSQDMEDEDEKSSPGLQTSLEPREPSTTASKVLMNINMSEDEDDDDDVPNFIGLGFDPTKNMDSVMQSPSAKMDAKTATTNQLNGVDFEALSLNPPLCGISANNHNHIFAFGSSATWGTGGDSNDWGTPMLPGSSNAGTISASRLFGGVLGTTDEGPSLVEDHDDDAAFISLTTGIPGLLAGGAEDTDLTGDQLVGGD